MRYPFLFSVDMSVRHLRCICIYILCFHNAVEYCNIRKVTAKDVRTDLGTGH